ncbi:ABC transporter permease [Acidaminobacter hydrogenoformans]|uniref:Putative ABC transport system permease protein n=1 Tax=Acidaminobacter hydrogenoformans DSM 2784 TaxID=1120920 RepID=A0A1G5RXF1_9FIRM|nr:iron export ABC transporter permease subunit FetB [Acidaminobacter hydrogenoformans]SCZ78587.1 putative ABC transport system permease protein [Acidaminobacter hydrogenoformans DSM 2784]
MSGVITLSVWQVMLSYVFVLVVLSIVIKRGIRREREILLASLRMTVQLILTGYVLTFIFSKPNPFITLLIITLMVSYAIFTVFQKFRGKLSAGLKKTIAGAMAAGTFSCIFYFILVVVQIDPWYQPQYFIPLAGMMIGNSMTGISLGVKSLIDGMTTQRQLVEDALNLGATPKVATHDIINSTFDAAIMPSINSMLGMGVISLPGMMTGQILSGTAPTTAVTYQIAIMMGILGSVSLTVILLLQFGYKTFFNDQDQLI